MVEGASAREPVQFVNKHNTATTMTSLLCRRKTRKCLVNDFSAKIQTQVSLPWQVHFRGRKLESDR
jgi:hypothetical protein